ncbi:TRAP transporter large permease [Glycomyces buryatensis]|uniref:TRAP transporter large permease n=1 Tax=Glycomyces buryatensis TaxID=2570927 RepID=A0A4V4HR46_9ACTN|nr:TRAP transporter large permease [Glycomyces buryatensis]THV36376.1 TRAP transporter large permease [Glycomyces buryatensis]
MTMLLLALAIAALLMLRVPVAFAFLGPCLGYLAIEGQSLGLPMRTIVNGIASFPLLAVPLFVLVGTTATRAGIADRIFDFALAILGRVRGSLGYVNVGFSLGFSWISGTAVADAAAMAKVQLPVMEAKGYSRRFSLGVTGASSLISPVMPPSIPAVVYAGIATVSTGALFAASVVPALLMAFGLCIVVYVLCRSKPELEGEPFNWSRLGRAARRAIGALFAPVIILGGILGGFFTPTEAAAVGAAYMFILGFSYRSLKLKDLPVIFRETAVTTAAILIIIASASLLGWILAMERVPQQIASTMLSLTDSPMVFLALSALLMLVLGTVIDAVAALVITVPIMLPIAMQVGVDPIVLGVVMIISLMIGLLTPPVGTVLYVLSSATGAKIGEVFRGTRPFFIPLVTVVVVVIVVPGAVMWLPNLLGL